VNGHDTCALQAYLRHKNVQRKLPRREQTGTP
jgi:hypothetical protein